jgi:hypothetical protein
MKTLMTNNTEKTTSIIAATAMILSIGLPNIFAETPIADWYWDDDANICYLDTELNTLNWSGAGTGYATQIKARIANAVSTYNAYMNGVDLNNNDTCSGDRIELGAQDLAEATYLAQLTDWDETSNILSQADIDFNTDFTFYGDTNQCYPYYDIEWVANHEIGHAVGLDHNEGWFANSVMVPNCAGSWSTIQSDDSDALDTHYG